MKLNSFFVFALSFFLQIIVSAQNLIPDPDFERMQKEPRKDRNGINCTRYWMNAVLTGGDYYNSLAGSSFFGVGVPRNIFGYQKAHSGEGYAGICIEKNMVEYVETKLLQRLVKGQTYHVEFFISRAEHRLGFVEEFGAMFLEKPIWSHPSTGIQSKPQIEFVNKSGFKNKKEWIMLSADYIAEGNESVIVIGYFNHNSKVKGKSHYYIDDVSIIPMQLKQLKDSKPNKNMNDSISSPVFEKEFEMDEN